MKTSTRSDSRNNKGARTASILKQGHKQKQIDGNCTSRDASNGGRDLKNYRDASNRKTPAMVEIPKIADIRYAINRKTPTMAEIPKIAVTPAIKRRQQ